jgi:hypothetical protein
MNGTILPVHVEAEIHTAHHESQVKPSDLQFSKAYSSKPRWLTKLHHSDKFYDGSAGA